MSRVMRKQQSAFAKTKTQISFAVTAKLISAFVFATWIVQYLYFLNTKFQASSHLQWLHSLVCVRPGQKPHCWLSHVAAHIYFFSPFCPKHRLRVFVKNVYQLNVLEQNKEKE